MARRLISSGSPFEERVGYSRAVVQGPWCFLAGVAGYDYSTMTLPGTLTAQVRNCFATVRTTLEDAGFAFGDIVRVTHYVADRDQIDALIPILGKELSPVRPAATLVIAGLILPEMLYEIEVTAYRGS